MTCLQHYRGLCRAVLLCLLLPSLLVQSAEATRGEKILYMDCPDFSTSSAQNGGAADKGGFPGDSGWTLTESSRTDGDSAASSSGASGFRSLPLPKDSSIVQSINEVLALPAGTPPVYFAVSFDLSVLRKSDNFLSAEFFLDFSGGKAPQSRTVASQRNFFRKLRTMQAGESHNFNSANSAELLFPVWPCGGSKEIEGLTFVFGMRVETGASEQAIAVNNLTVAQIPLTPEFSAISNGEQEAQTTPEDKQALDICFVGNLSSQPSRLFLEAAAAAGLALQPRRADLSVPADIYVITGGGIASLPATQIEAARARGAVILCDLNDRHYEKIPDETAALLPVNVWSIHQQNLRADGGVAPIAETGFMPTTPGDDSGLLTDWRYDLHLPFSPVESGHHRYEPEVYGKSPQNTGWQALMRADLDGGLPMLVRGRSGRGTVYIFGSDLFAPRLITSPGYAKFCKTLLEELVQNARENHLRIARKQETAEGLELRIAAYQPEKTGVEVVNSSARARRLVLSARVNAYSGALLNKYAVEIDIPAKSSRVIPLPLKNPQTGAAEVGSVDEETPYLRITAALLPEDYGTVLLERAGVVCTAPALDIEILEDTASYDGLKEWPNSDEFPDGRIGRRYAYNCGEEATFELVLRNGLLNLAPLARPADVLWPENPTTGGLNDLSYSNASLRGRLPRQGGWAGKQSPRQELRLDWDIPVTLAGISLAGFGDYRNWDKNNPRNFSLSALHTGQSAVLLETEDTAFLTRWGPNAKRPMKDSRRAYYDASFAPHTASACVLSITGLDPKASYENSHYRPANCALSEWQVWGWPGKTPPPALKLRLRAELHDLRKNTEEILLDEELNLAQMSATIRRLQVPTRTEFTPARLDISLSDSAGRILRAESVPLLYVARDDEKMQNKATMYSASTSLLCSPGVVQANDFGKGMRDHTQGWGGPHDKLWMLLRGLMEWGSGTRHRLDWMLTTPGGITHYTNPWKAMPDGTVGWDMVAGQFLESCLSGHRKNSFKEGQPRSFHVFGSDRWNGIPVGNSFGWPEYIEFDRYLREKTGRGLQARGMAQIGREVAQEYGDRWQEWHMARYSQRMLKTQEMFAEHDIKFTFESHGSFPLAGGELGRQLAMTHEGVGTDLFWELRAQDLIWSIGTRFGVGAVNPDLRSGAYNQWGWINSDLNRFWFANNSNAEPATRQWYATYFAGLINLNGDYKPYHMMGFSRQGDYGTIMLPEDYRQMFRVQNLTTQVRPQHAAGFCLVASWPGQERRTGPRLQHMGFGIFPAKGEQSVDFRFGEIYHKLVKNGLPLSFMTSTDGLEKWGGTQPLVLVDGYNYLPEEMKRVIRLNKAGAPIIAIGGYAELGQSHAAASALYGVKYENGKFMPSPGVKTHNLPGGGVLYQKDATGGAGAVLFCPHDGRDLAAIDARSLVQAMLEAVNSPLRLPPGLVATTFINNGGLWLALGDLGDTSRNATLRLRPEWFMPGLAGKKLCVIDMDTHRELPATLKDGALELTLPFAATAGRMLRIVPAGQ